MIIVKAIYFQNMVKKYKINSRNTDLQEETNSKSSSPSSYSDTLLEKKETCVIVSLAIRGKDLLSEEDARNEQDLFNGNVEKVFNEKPLLWPQILAALAVAFVHLGFGVVGGFSGIILPALTNPNSTDIYLTTDQAATFTSSAGIGLMIGAIPAGCLSNWLGQRVTIIWSLPIGVCGWTMLYFANSIPMLIVSRGMMGILSGTCLTACLTYIIEVAHTSVRGRLLAMVDLFRQFGFTFVAVVGSSSLHWRTVGLVCGLSSFIPPLILLIFLPNSPRWLATRGRQTEARSSLQFLRGSSFHYENELQSICVQIENSTETNRKKSQLHLLFRGAVFKRFLLLAILMFCINFVGNVAMATYNITIFQAAKTGINEYMSTILSTIMRICGTATYIGIADRFNRKTILMVPLFLTSLTLVSMGTYFFLLTNNYNTENIKWMPLASMMLYLYCTGLFVPVIMLLSGELLPTPVRAAGNGIIFWVFSVAMFLVMFTFPYLFEYVGPHWTFWLYCLNAYFIMFITAVFIPETKGKTLEEIGDL